MTRRGRTGIRRARAADARRMHELISAGVAEGHLLPRTLEDVRANAARFLVATRGRRVIGCAELAPIGPHVAEVRSLVVDPSARALGAGSRLVEEIRAEARRSGVERLCAFTHAPGLFTRLGFSLVPHRWVPEKIAADCLTCGLFRRCRQLALILPLEPAENAVDHDRPWVLRA